MNGIKFDLLTSTSDLHIDEFGNMVIISGNDETIQSILHEVKSNSNDFYLNTAFGTNYMQDDESGLLDRKGVTNQEIEDEILRVVFKNEDVNTAIVDSIVRDGRNTDLSINLTTKDGGDITIDTSLI